MPTTKASGSTVAMRIPGDEIVGDHQRTAILLAGASRAAFAPDDIFPGRCNRVTKDEDWRAVKGVIGNARVTVRRMLRSGIVPHLPECCYAARIFEAAGLPQLFTDSVDNPVNKRDEISASRRYARGSPGSA